MTQPHTLLAKALSTLSEEEQGAVLQSLLPTPAYGSQPSNWVSGSTAAMAGMALGHKERVAAAFGVQQLREQASASEQSSLLVRLPTPVHAELKQWAEDHGHSMNTVMRGLLERFLDAQREVPGGNE